MENTANKILEAMFSVEKPLSTFILVLIIILMVFYGKVTFKNLSRYCEMNEKHLSRWY